MKLIFFTKQSNSFSGNVIRLMSGTAFAQALGILVSPIVTRLFAPDDYGVAALFLSITAIIGVIVCLRYELAIMLPKTNEEAVNILGICFCATFLMTIIASLFALCGGDYIIQLTNAPELKKYLWLIPMAILFTGFSSALNYWNTRTKHFGRISIIQVISSITTQATKITAGFAGLVSGGTLIITGILGSIVTSTALGGKIWHNDKHLLINNVTWQGIADGFVRYRNFLIIDTWGALLNAISWQLPALMLSSFFSIPVVGFYALGLTVVKAPLNILSGALAQVFYQKASEEKNIKNQNIGVLVENLMDRLMFIGLMPLMILAMIGEELFSVLFGARWKEAGLYTQILAPWIFFWFISSPLSTLFSVYERQGAALSAHFLIFITRLISLYVGGIYQSIYLALVLFTVTGIVTYAFVVAWNINLAKANGERILLTFLKYTLYFSPVLICVFLIKYIFSFGEIIVLATAVVTGVVYLFIFKNKYYSIIKH